MNIVRSSQWLYLGSGIYAALCIPAIFVAERWQFSQRPFHTTQFIAVLICAMASPVFLRATKTRGWSWTRILAATAFTLCSLWLVFFVYVVYKLDFSAID